MCLCVFPIAINEDEAMNLKESRRTYGKVWREKIERVNIVHIIISKNKNKSLKKDKDKDRSVNPDQCQ